MGHRQNRRSLKHVEELRSVCGNFSFVAEAEATPGNSSVRSVALLILCVLLALNAFLYYRLYDLEDRIVNNVSFKNLGLDANLFK